MRLISFDLLHNYTTHIIMKRRTILRGLPLAPFLSENMFIHSNTQDIVNQEFICKKTMKPKRLKLGDTLGVIAPSSAINDNKIEQAIKSLTDLGFKLKLGKNLRAQNGYLAGSDAQRLEDLHWAFSDKEVDAVWCIRGGYGATRILPNVDFNLIKKKFLYFTLTIYCLKILLHFIYLFFHKRYIFYLHTYFLYW